MQWKQPILTDSGGFQVFSLADNRQVDEDGVTFKSHIDGSTHRFTPEISISIQENLGADIIMAFDECAEPYDRAYTERSVERTHRWAERSLQAHSRRDQDLFGILQGGIHLDLREQSARYLTSLAFPGYAIGGLSVGETKAEMHSVLDLVDDILPEDKPRYLMGVGTPEDLVNGVLRGVDIFDCVLPTRLARHNAVITRQGRRLNLVNAAFASDPAPIDETCECYTCSQFSRAYLRHLIASKEMLSATLLSIHNLFTMLELARDLQKSILEGTLDRYAETFFSRLEEPAGQVGEFQE
jgi:queuine tRNA-ribosyltransferase